MIAALFFALLLSVADPVGDAVGNGDLRLPTAAVYRTPGIFDAQEITVLDADNFSFSITMGKLNNPWNLPNGFSLPLIEIYLASEDTDIPSQAELLPGSGMRLPNGVRWNYAFKLTGESFEVFTPGPNPENTRDVTRKLAARLVVEGNKLTITTNLVRPKRYSLYGTVGSYDPFAENGWRPVETEASAWALSSPTQRVRAIDVLADSLEAQQRAIDSGILAEIRSPNSRGGWLLLMLAGIAIIGVGLFGRYRLKPTPAMSPDGAAAVAEPLEQSQAAASDTNVPIDTDTSPISLETGRAEIDSQGDYHSESQQTESEAAEASSLGDWLAESSKSVESDGKDGDDESSETMLSETGNTPKTEEDHSSVSLTDNNTEDSLDQNVKPSETS